VQKSGFEPSKRYNLGNITELKAVPVRMPADLKDKTVILTKCDSGFKRVIGIYPRLSDAESALLEKTPGVRFDSVKETRTGFAYMLDGKKVAEVISEDEPSSADPLNGPGY